MVAAYIGLGSNLDHPAEQLYRAFRALAQIPNTKLIRYSSLYQSPPMGGLDQPDYINAVAVVETALKPEELLLQLQAIETAQGRTRGERWGARTLDLDLLLYGSDKIDMPDLKVPHPGMHERAFVLYPLFEIAPELEIPRRGRLIELLENCPSEGLIKI
ncbi:MAG: 2-amino-4-hydroxy-6-hydroxymethyldihydropteridine diphosphokinase [Gammaproteobacteria bacterium]|nr:2-amino-4-hydroxy-6-hydroxymethyldihydropteridine diphosphokinase [Gammaproteobacteria bacterium]